MESILEKLFLGKLHPFEDKGVLTDEGYREAMESQERLAREFEEELTPEQMERLKEYSDKSCKMCYAVAKHNFMLGFRLGCKLMAEALK